ncbi:aminotransferase class I/II-fold pyridoxal phosphate-dependent enzyme [Candidatus Micrarchaeota archaeon]|nr:aminotransferase class I/II-fold pyridoxal phosphate-dependent enzyme [Candidatus Micrarchaeota archaeon]
MALIRITNRAQKASYPIRDVEIGARVAALKKKGVKTYELNIGDPGAYDGLYGFAMFKGIKDALVHNIQTNGRFDGYATEQGERVLLEAVAADAKKRGIHDAKPDNVVAGNGLSEIVDYLIGVSVEKGTNMVLPRPDYPLYTARVNWYEGTPRYYDLDPENALQPKVEQIEAAIDGNTFAVVNINPSNPTGAVCTEEKMKAIIDVVKDKGKGNVAILSDEIYRLLRFEGKHVSMASLTKDVPVITLDGLSKGYYAPGWRTGHALFSNFPDDKLKNALVKVCGFRLSANKAVQHAYAHGIRHFSEDDAEARKYLAMLKERANYTSQRLNAIPGIRCVPPKGAFYAFPQLLKGPWKTDKEFVIQLLEEEGVRVVHGSGFAMKPEDRFFRVVTLPDLKTQKEAYDRIERFVKKYG